MDNKCYTTKYKKKKLVAGLCVAAMVTQNITTTFATELPSYTKMVTYTNNETVSRHKTSLPETGDIVYGEKEVVNINKGWTFTNYNGQQLGVVDLPHSWEGPYSMNSFTATYEKQLDVAKYKGKNLFLKFYGVNKNTVLYINGHKISTDVNGDGVILESEPTHIGGFSAFTIDITDYVTGDIVDIKIETTNFDLKTMPINTDFTHFAGIYRDVELVATSNIYFATEDYGSKGIYVTPKVDLKNNVATVDIKAAISYEVEANQEVTLRATLKDANNREVEQTEVTAYLEEGKTIAESIVLPSMTIDDPHLWNGIADPYLYTMDIEILDTAGNVLDGQTQRIGIREYKVDSTGFYLNGELYPLRGVGFHQDREGYGNAVPKSLRLEDLNTVKEIGANAIRTTHYPHEEYVYDLADEMGLVVWAEIPFYLIRVIYLNKQLKIN